MLFIFDWDGTVSNSAQRIIQCMQDARREIGLEAISDAAIQNIIGLGLPEAIRTLYPEISDANLEALRDAYSRHFSSNDAEPSPLFCGVLETLQELRNRGYLLSVATGKSRRGLNRVLNKLEMHSFFDSSRCADETASKPDPKMLTELLEVHGLSAGQAVMVGDTEYDMEMAQQIDMPRIAVSYGAHGVARLKQYQPGLIVDNFSEILAWEF